MNSLFQAVSTVQASVSAKRRCLVSQEKQKKHSMRRVTRSLAVILISQFCASNSWASGANFKISGDNIELAERRNIYTASVTVGQPLEIVASGFAYPSVVFEFEPTPQELEKATKGGAAKSEAATWMFDHKALRLRRTDSDGTRHKIVLEAKTSGRHMVRFVGVILGRMDVHEIEVNVSAVSRPGAPSDVPETAE